MNSKIATEKRGDLVIGYSEKDKALSETFYKIASEAFSPTKSIRINASGKPEVGRAAVQEHKINEQKCVLRFYFRGGFVRFFNNRTFIRNTLKGCRAYQEFEILNSLLNAKVHVPEPVFFGIKRNLFTEEYLLVTKKLEDYKNFFTAIKHHEISESKAREIALLAGKEAKKVLEHRVFHPDLHPGNVLFKNVLLKNEDKSTHKQGWQVAIIDFDKASFFQHSPKDMLEFAISGKDTARINQKPLKGIFDYLLFFKYFTKILFRWRRFVKKYKLDSFVDTNFRKGLFSKNK